MMRIGLAVLALSVSGCTAFEPYQRTDVWSPSGANAGNIAAMAVRPSDLIVGRSANTGDAHQAAGAVEHIWQDQPKALPNATSAPPPAGAGAAAAPPPAAAAAPPGGSN